MHVLRSRIGLAAVGLTFGLFAIFALEPARAAQREPDRPRQTVPAVYVGNQRMNTPAFVDHGQLFVPVRGVFEAIDATVTFTPPHFIVVRKDSTVIAAFILDRTHAIVGNQAVDLDAAPVKRDGHIYIPLRVVAQAAGATVAYTDRPPAVHIRPSGATTASDGAAAETTAERPASARWRMGLAVFTGICCLGCLVITARRFAPTLFGSAPKHGVTPPADETATIPPPPDRVALSSREATGEARLRKEIVKETRTIEVPVTREELVIEYSGEGGNVLIHGRALASGETVRIPLWEERVSIDVTKYVLLEDDIVVGKRRVPARPVADSDGHADFGVAEGSPS